MKAGVISEAFLLRELGALRIPVHDIIGFSEVITSEKFNPINPKYRQLADGIQKSTRYLMDLSVEVIDLLIRGIIESNSERPNDIKTVSICESIFTPCMRSLDIQR